MLTPQQVQEKCFSKAFMGGYDMGEVDDFLDPLSEDYAALYKENAVLKSKMKVLVEKIEEYRATEESMRQALRSAKAMASDIVEEAQRKTEAAPAPAPAVPVAVPAVDDAQLKSLRAQVAAEEQKLQRIKEAQAAYIAGMRRVLKSQGETLDELEAAEGAAPAPAPAAPAEPEPAPAPAEEPEERLPVWEPRQEAPAEESAENAESEKDTVAGIVESVNEFFAEQERDAELTPTGDAAVDQIGIFDNDPTIVLPDLDEAAGDPDATRKIQNDKFANLKFGKDYEIK